MASTRDKNGRKSKWDTPASANEAAREAARKLNAMLAAKGKLNTNATPPLQPAAPRSTAVANNNSSSSSEIFTAEIEINDSPRRLLLCKGTVQSEINKYSGALISIKGQYIPAAEKGNFPGQKPLYLLIQSPSKENLNLAVKRIHEILQGDDPFSSPPIQPSLAMSQSSALPSGMHYVQEKVFVGLDNVPTEFNLKEKIVGPGESYLQHITRETGAKIQLRGRGSGFIEPTSGREAFETLYVYISHNSYPGLGAAKKLVENLIETVTNEYQEFQMQRSSNIHYSGYGGQGNTRNQHFPRIYMPPVPRYGIPPHHGNTPTYPPYPHPTNQYPPRYNQPQQPPPNHHMNSGSQPPHTLYPPMPEGSRHGMNEPPVQHGSPYPMPRMQQLPARDLMYAPEIQSPLQQEPGQLNNDRRGQPLSASERPSETREKQSKTEDEKPGPPRRRFTEAPVKPKPTPALASNPRSADKRSVSSLGQPSASSSTFSNSSEVVRKSTMLAPVLPAPRASNTKTDDATGAFKTPLLPLSLSISVPKRNPPSSSTNLGQKRKLDESEKKSTGIALLGSYDDSSDEEDEETVKRLRNNRS